MVLAAVGGTVGLTAVGGAVVLIASHHVAVTISVAMAEVATTETVAHSATRTGTAIVATVVPAAASVVMPGVGATIDTVERGAAEVVVVAVGIAGVDGEVPASGVPIERAIEVGGVAEGAILPLQEDVAHVEVPPPPVVAGKVIHRVDAHQVVEVDLVGGFILRFAEVQLVSHLVGQEQCLLACLLIAHGAGRQGEQEQGSHGEQ